MDAQKPRRDLGGNPFRDRIIRLAHSDPFRGFRATSTVLCLVVPDGRAVGTARRTHALRCNHRDAARIAPAT